MNGARRALIGSLSENRLIGFHTRCTNSGGPNNVFLYPDTAVVAHNLRLRQQSPYGLPLETRQQQKMKIFLQMQKPGLCQISNVTQDKNILFLLYINYFYPVNVSRFCCCSKI